MVHFDVVNALAAQLAELWAICPTYDFGDRPLLPDIGEGYYLIDGCEVLYNSADAITARVRAREILRKKGLSRAR